MKRAGDRVELTDQEQSFIESGERVGAAIPAADKILER